MRNDRHSGGVRLAGYRGEEIPFHVFGQLDAIRFSLQRCDCLFRIGGRVHHGTIAARKRSGRASIWLVSDCDSRTEIKAWTANVSGVETFLNGRLPRQRVAEIVDSGHTVSEKHLPHIRSIVNV